MEHTPSKLLTARELGEMLIEQDPDGKLFIHVRAFNEDDKDFPIAFGELYRDEISINVKHGQQTHEGDKDLVRLEIRLDS